MTKVSPSMKKTSHRWFEKMTKFPIKRVSVKLASEEWDKLYYGRPVIHKPTHIRYPTEEERQASRFSKVWGQGAFEQKLMRSVLINRFREARIILKRRKQVLIDFASRFPEFTAINSASRRKGLSTNEQFTELRTWFYEQSRKRQDGSVSGCN